MTPAQIRLARAALGLPNNYRRSYRNRFFTVEPHPGWEAMVAAGLATTVVDPAMTACPHGYFLTRAGAEAALEPRERLDREDFPE